MRCKRHPTDLSSGVGVCASCLRERLFALIVAQSRQQAQVQAEGEGEDRRKSDAQHPPSLVFPRSVSPYIYRSSDNDHQQFDQRFNTTPRVRPASAPSTTTTAGAAPKKKKSKFSFFAFLFGSKSEEPEADVPDPRDSRVFRSSLATTPTSPSMSQTWFSTFIPNSRKKQSRLFSVEDVNATDGGRRTRREDRGLSPARAAVEEHHGDYEDSSGYSADSSPQWRKQGLQSQSTPPQATPTRDRRRGQHNRNVSGLAMCFSPLVRASPSRQHHRNVGSSHVW
ncbi:uncharacterized protein LOC122663962 [Telopea speciosissima]|uniref:uncharacterized protein LOC122663962 n=1 Tax=Telopea speciosissima TaxID=54955 RepID=UPI001CC76974|nr:uncharacterized protein LOC122663962 [Telopea speciosissima]